MIDLSVHLITYNNEKHIEQTLQSILRQKVNFNYEIVVGDDCSTDNTLNIINQYKAKHPNLFDIKKNKQQLGILGNFKTTLDRCKGLYIFDIAGDDLLKHDYSLQKMVDILKNDSSLGFIDSGVDKFYEENNTIKPFSNSNNIKAPINQYKEQLLLGKILPIGICFNKKLLYQHVDFDRYFNMKITIEDYPILVDLAMNTNIYKVNEVLHVYRIHHDSYSNKKTFESHAFLNLQMKNLFDFFNKKYEFPKDIIQKFNNNYYKQLLFLAGYFEKKEVGKKAFNKIKTKSIKDYIHYQASQSSFFRKLVSII